MQILDKYTVWDTIYTDRVIVRVMPPKITEHHTGSGHGLDNPCNQPCKATFHPNFYSEVPEHDTV